MRCATIVKSFLFACIGLAATVQLYAQTSPSKKDTRHWIEEKHWKQICALDIHPTVNKDSFYAAYHRNPNLWDAAFKFLATHNLDTMSTGKYPIVGELMFASITEEPSHNKEDVKWESHKRYIDLQYIIKGKELIGIADTAKATITKPYSPDAMNYSTEGKYYVAGQGRFFLFFANDAHRPTIKVDGYDVVKKIVIKIQSAKAEE